MDRLAFRSRRKPTLAWIAAAPMAAIAFAAGAHGAERVVLWENFSATWCGPCISAAPTIDAMLHNYGVDGNGTLAMIDFHVSDPPWSYPWGEQRADFYFVTGIPTFAYDGVTRLVGYPTPLEATFLSHQAIPTTVTMDMTVQETAPREFTVTVDVCNEPEAETFNLRFYAVFLEDHFPAGSVVSRNTFRYVAPTLPTIRLDPAECEQVVTVFDNVVAQISEQNLKVVAWVQIPAANWPSQVHQAAIAAYPFAPPPPPCPWDCLPPGDGVVNVADFLAMLSEWGGPGDCDFEDPLGVVNVADFLALLANWGPCPE
jgi:thiol-disulfide isomerase/thioredoxin